MTRLRTLRAQFPALERFAYLNAGTDGPVSVAAHDAAVAALAAQRDEPRWAAHFETRFAEQAALRERYARLLGCAGDDIALTTSTSEGLGKVLAGMGLRPGDEILTAEDEHPGLIGPLLAARERGVAVRTAPLDRIASAVTSSTTVVACSHVSWISGAYADRALADVDVPVVFDGAQSAGAVPVDVTALGCAAYAGPGQKWLCGSDGSGLLYVAPSFRDRVSALGPGYTAFEATDQGLESPLRTTARRHDTPALGRETVAMSLAAFDVLEAAGWDEVHRRGPALGARLAGALEERGLAVAPRDDTTLVAWEDPEPEATSARLVAEGVIVRNLPGTRYLRASTGAWNDEDDLERLLGAL